LLQQAVSSIAAELASVAGRLSNSRTWGSLSGTADALHVASAADPIALTRRLGEAYPTLLRLGRFLETDIRIQRDPTSLDDPLDPDVQGLLTDLVRTAAPWLRGFPTVEAWDDAAGRYLLRVNLLSAARDFIRVARAKGAISETSASRMEWIEEDEHQGFQGQKANAWGVGGAQNLILATAEVMALFLSGALPSGAGSQSLLVERAAATLSEAGEQVEKFAETLPSDLGQALRELVKEAALSTQSSSPRATGESVPPDVEEQAATMILEGHSPPAAWRPFIRRLSFKGTNLSALDLLANLNALEELDLRSTSVTDISPLAELSTLRTLDLRGTVVNDVSALSNLRALQNLNLRFTSVQDITPLSRLVELTFLDLRRAQVSDISPISDLTNLQ
jgi:hypothetical protein